MHWKCITFLWSTRKKRTGVGILGRYLWGFFWQKWRKLYPAKKLSNIIIFFFFWLGAFTSEAFYYLELLTLSYPLTNCIEVIFKWTTKRFFCLLLFVVLFFLRHNLNSNISIIYYNWKQKTKNVFNYILLVSKRSKKN